MISIRTGLVALAFLAMGLTAAIERLTQTEDNPQVTAAPVVPVPDKTLRFTRKMPAVAAPRATTPRI